MKYILLCIEDNLAAHQFAEDATEYPDSPLLTPCQENTVYATILSVRDNLGEDVPAVEFTTRLQLAQHLSDLSYRGKQLSLVHAGVLADHVLRSFDVREKGA